MFPAQPTPRKEDLLMESGEYWLSAEQRAAKGQQEKSAFRQRTSVDESSVKLWGNDVYTRDEGWSRQDARHQFLLLGREISVLHDLLRISQFDDQRSARG